MKHFSITCLFLLMCIKALANMADSRLIEPRSLISDAPRELNMRSIGASAVLSDEEKSANCFHGSKMTLCLFLSNSH